MLSGEVQTCEADIGPSVTVIYSLVFDDWIWNTLSTQQLTLKKKTKNKLQTITFQILKEIS